MKVLSRLVSLGLAAMLLPGCASRPKVMYHISDANPPEFLAGPMALLLTNVDGFSAKITGSIASENGLEHTVAGDLLGREGSLIFQPRSSVKGKRARSEGGMFFIWNEGGHAGYVLSDPLQAYAPMAGTVQPTNLVLDATGAVEEEANGHPCRRVEAVVQSSDGTSERFKIWEAEDAKHFPVRIQTAMGPRQMVINFSELRLELPPAQLFAPPDGFVKYDTPVTLMNELIIRQSALAKQKEYAPLDMGNENGTGVSNWRPNPAQ